MAGGVDPPVLTGKIINCTDFPARQVELPKGIPYGNESHSWYPVVNPKVFGCESLTPVNYFWVITTVIYSYFCNLQFWWTSGTSFLDLGHRCHGLQHQTLQRLLEFRPHPNGGMVGWRPWAMGRPPVMVGLCHGKSQQKMDDDWGYPSWTWKPSKSSQICVNLPLTPWFLGGVDYIGQDCFQKPETRGVEGFLGAPSVVNQDAFLEDRSGGLQDTLDPWIQLLGNWQGWGRWRNWLNDTKRWWGWAYWA